MKELIRLQTEVATGRFTLPVVILVCLLLWGVSYQEWNELFSLLITLFIGYIFIGTNTAFNLIRTRTTMPVCIYWLITTALFFLHPFDWSNFVPLVFVLAIYQHFLSYESPSFPFPIFHTFLFVSLGSLAFPQLLFITPLLWISMIPFRSMSWKNFWASLIGLMTPYWFLFGYAFFFEEMHLFLTPLKEAVHLYPIDFSHLTINELASWGFITLLLMICGFHYWQIAFKDRTRTRINHSFLVIAGFWTTILSILQPVHLCQWMSIQLVCMAFLSGHLFTLTRNRFSGILFIVTFVLYILLMSFNLWMQYFNS